MLWNKLVQRCLVPIFCSLVCMGVSHGAGPAYTSEYQATVLPQETSDTPLDPLWKFQGGATVAGIENNLLVVDSRPVEDGFWVIDSHGSDSVWDGAQDTTVDFSLQVAATTGRSAVVLFLGTGDGYAAVYFTPSEIEFSDSSIIRHENTSLTTYRLVLKNNTLTMYVAGTAEPLIADIPIEGEAGINRIYFGDASKGVGASFSVAHIGWIKGTALLSAPSEFGAARP